MDGPGKSWSDTTLASLPSPQLRRVLSPLKSHADFVYVSQVKCMTSSGKALKTLLPSHCPWILLCYIPLHLASAQNLASPPSWWRDRHGASGPGLLSVRPTVGKQAPLTGALGASHLIQRARCWAKLPAAPKYTHDFLPQCLCSDCSLHHEWPISECPNSIHLLRHRTVASQCLMPSRNPSLEVLCTPLSLCLYPSKITHVLHSSWKNGRDVYL